ncbi:GntR family transcriptional regulator [uncultured Cohaesibacter sp.]|uniref:GntR family transcriptional regulator n=1 Tax=uncultured Cohaesibacter sp. TaxID=1002546 RepID=UPI0029C838B8|nr:GntR family transcriptional regulator [uncultured Cohaesibacter sp.]
MSKLEPKPNSPLLRAKTTSDQLYSLLRVRILDLQLAPGAVIYRRELSEEYGVSPMPLREAIARLSAEGLIDIHPQSKTMVSKIDMDDVRRMHFMRMSVEMEVARVLADSFAPMVEAEEILRQQEVALSRNDIMEFSKLDRIFHRSFHAEAGYEELWDLVISHSGHIDRARKLNLPASGAGRAAKFLKDHQDMIRAVQNGSKDEASNAVREHLQRFTVFAEQARVKNPEFFK